MMTRNRMFSVAGMVGLSMLLFSGCTTKKYVREQTAPLMNHVNDLDAQTAKNTNAIRDVDARTQKGLAAANQTSEGAISQAQQAQGAAQQVNQHLDQTSRQIQSLDATVASLDDYKQVSESSVHFGFDKWKLTPEALQQLDQLAAQLSQSPHSILEVEGYTDSTGPATYNYKLSQRRADSVVQYLESKSIPPHRIFLIGLGENQAVASNHTLTGRKENRRVDLRVLVNALGQNANPNATPSAQQPNAQ